jgi:hypothetical protein
MKHAPSLFPAFPTESLQPVCNHLHFCTQSCEISLSDTSLFLNNCAYEIFYHNHHFILTVVTPVFESMLDEGWMGEEKGNTI